MLPIEIEPSFVRNVRFRDLQPGGICLASNRLFMCVNRKGEIESLCVDDYGDPTLRPTIHRSLRDDLVLEFSDWTPSILLRHKADHDYVSMDDVGCLVVREDGCWVVAQTAGESYTRTAQLVHLTSGVVQPPGDGVRSAIFSDWTWLAKFSNGEKSDLLRWPIER